MIAILTTPTPLRPVLGSRKIFHRPTGAAFPSEYLNRTHLRKSLQHKFRYRLASTGFAGRRPMGPLTRATMALLANFLLARLL